MNGVIVTALVQIALKLFMYWLDPDRQKREELEKKKQADADERDEYAKALQSNDLLTISYHLDQLLREAKANRASERSSAKTN